ncbi:response regulator [Kineosporia rhizophila]|uniref:response regulator n=1 Tax=Kineosporia TaxID=49184 RepID=UPI001E4923CE|nr:MULTISPECIES: response regulator [Kineosporia]MCE0539702.1 response regulator [Kineosporia rhizophila]GLY16403.1 transcriptional regulatory protein [Kineosporia sp. NBRC 101677]
MSPDHLIRTLIVEPDPVVASLHSEYVKKTADFTVGGVAYTGAEALQLLDTEPFGLILLDLQLPDISGLELCRILRARNSPVDIIVITAARQIGLVRSALSFGVVHYLLKPLTLRSFQGHLRRYATYHRRTTDSTGPINQFDIDSAIAQLRPDVRSEVVASRATSLRTLDHVASHLRTSSTPVTANEVAEALGISRVTARRYLEELTARRMAAQTQRYGSSGRPRNLYHWHAE